MIEQIEAKTLLSRMQHSEWFGADYNMNLYRGCCHGCIYCDSRSDCYHVEDFDRVRVKRQAAELLRRELTAKRKTGVVGIGAMSDSYNPFERELGVTRAALEAIADTGFGVSLETKSALVVRDIDLFRRIRDNHSAIVKLTITAADDALAGKIEPRASTSTERFGALRQLAGAGLYCGVLMTPILPYITDFEENLVEIVRKTAEAGGKFVFSMYGVTLRANQRQYYFDRLDERFPGLSARYKRNYGGDYYCPAPRHAELRELMRKTCREYGLVWRMPDIIHGYQGEEKQLSLF